VNALDPNVRRQSNEGHRKVDLQERVLIFLTRIRWKRSFKEMGYLYGCGKDSARRYYDEMVDLFSKHLVPLLVFPRSPDELLAMASQTTRERFPDLLGILDATNWPQQKPENFLPKVLSGKVSELGMRTKELDL
jgi:Helix-turn-helix of DDE superfamily endonuclease